MNDKLKKAIGYIASFFVGVAAVAGIVTRAKLDVGRGNLARIRTANNELRDGQRKLDAIAKSDADTIKQARTELDRASDVNKQSGKNISRAGDLIAELRKRKSG